MWRIIASALQTQFEMLDARVAAAPLHFCISVIACIYAFLHFCTCFCASAPLHFCISARLPPVAFMHFCISAFLSDAAFLYLCDCLPF
jgi:hypothetical protein